MAKQSLGLIETIGLTAAVEAADAAVKSANVTLVGYELSKGDGMTMVKVQGDVGAVTAAISAAAVAAGKVGRVVSTRVIARPADPLDVLINTPDTVGLAHPKVSPVSAPCAPAQVAKPQQTVPEQVAPEQAPDAQAAPAAQEVAVETPSTEDAPHSKNAEDSDADADEEPHEGEQSPAPADGAEKADSQKKRKKKK